MQCLKCTKISAAKNDNTSKLICVYQHFLIGTHVRTGDYKVECAIKEEISLLSIRFLTLSIENSLNCVLCVLRKPLYCPCAHDPNSSTKPQVTCGTYLSWMYLLKYFHCFLLFKGQIYNVTSYIIYHACFLHPT